MRYWRSGVNIQLAFVLALSLCGLSLGCLTVCAAQVEESPCAQDESSFELTEYDDDCCSLDALRSLPPDRVQKTPVVSIYHPLTPASNFGFRNHCQALAPFATFPQPDKSAPLQQSAVLRI
jgi:hypothetical protein